MQPTFVVTNPLKELALDRGKGELAWTITNTTAAQVRGRLDLSIDLRDGVDPKWFKVEQPTIRILNPNETLAVNVEVEVPPEIDEQQPRVSLTVSNVERPQEDYQVGPAVTVRNLHWELGPRKTPWYRKLWFIILMVVLGLGIVGGAIGFAVHWSNRDKLKGSSLVEALRYVHENNLDLGQIRWTFDPTIRDKTIISGGSVLESKIVEGEVELVIQLWHDYDTQDKLGFTRQQRAENVEKVVKKVPQLKKKPLPLANWLSLSNSDELTKAKEDAVPIDFFSKEYKVAYDADFQVNPKGK